eukprot:356454-Chlamydomonas_euryale.AAC.6
MSGDRSASTLCCLCERGGRGRWTIERSSYKQRREASSYASTEVVPKAAAPHSGCGLELRQQQRAGSGVEAATGGPAALRVPSMGHP